MVAPLSGPLAFFEVAGRLLDATVVRLAAPTVTGGAGAPERACVTVGELADDECECGTLYVAIQRTYLSDQPPAEQAGFTAGGVGGGSPCGPAYVVADLAVRVMRCAPSPDGRDLAPTCEALTASARQAESDALMIYTWNT